MLKNVFPLSVGVSTNELAKVPSVHLGSNIKATKELANQPIVRNNDLALSYGTHLALGEIAFDNSSNSYVGQIVAILNG